MLLAAVNRNLDFASFRLQMIDKQFSDKHRQFASRIVFSKEWS